MASEPFDPIFVGWVFSVVQELLGFVTPRARISETVGYVPNESARSFPTKRYFSRHSIEPFGWTSRKRPPPSDSLKGLSAGFVLRMSKWVSGMGVSPFDPQKVFPQNLPPFGAKQCDGMHRYERCK